MLVVDYEREPRLTLVAEAAALAGEAPPGLLAGDAQVEDGNFVTIKDVMGQDGSGELYGWVPRDLVNASPAKLMRALSCVAPAAVDGDMTMDRTAAFATVSAGPVGATVDVAMDHACWDYVGAAAPETRWGGAPPGGVVEAASRWGVPLAAPGPADAPNPLLGLPLTSGLVPSLPPPAAPTLAAPLAAPFGLPGGRGRGGGFGRGRGAGRASKGGQGGGKGQGNHGRGQGDNSVRRDLDVHLTIGGDRNGLKRKAAGQ